MFKWKNKFKPLGIFKKLSEDISLKDDKVSIPAFEHIHAQLAVKSHLEIPKNLPWLESERLVTMAIFTTAKTSFTCDKFLEVLNQQYTEYKTTLNKMQPKQFHLLATISLDKNTDLAILKINDCTISILNRSIIISHNKIDVLCS